MKKKRICPEVDIVRMAESKEKLSQKRLVPAGTQAIQRSGPQVFIHHCRKVSEGVKAPLSIWCGRTCTGSPARKWTMRQSPATVSAIDSEAHKRHWSRSQSDRAHRRTALERQSQ